MMDVRRNCLALGALSTLVTLTSCGVGSNLEIYRVAWVEGVQSSGCYANDTIPADVANDSSTIFGSTTLWVYDGPGDYYYLDLGAETLEGTKTDKGYAFEGEIVDVEFDAGDDKWTTRTLKQVDAETGSDWISGTFTVTVSHTCHGEDCRNVPPTCTVRQAFAGTKIPITELEYVHSAPSAG